MAPLFFDPQPVNPLFLNTAKKEEDNYHNVSSSIKGAEKSQMFGNPCYKINGKAFVAFFKHCMVLKLGGKEHETAFALPGAILFDPSGKNRPMKEWVQVPFSRASEWKLLAGAAFKYVGGN